MIQLIIQSNTKEKYRPIIGKCESIFSIAYTNEDIQQIWNMVNRWEIHAPVAVWKIKPKPILQETT